MRSGYFLVTPARFLRGSPNRVFWHRWFCQECSQVGCWFGWRCALVADADGAHGRVGRLRFVAVAARPGISTTAPPRRRCAAPQHGTFFVVAVIFLLGFVYLLGFEPLEGFRFLRRRDLLRGCARHGHGCALLWCAVALPLPTPWLRLPWLHAECKNSVAGHFLLEDLRRESPGICRYRSLRLSMTQFFYQIRKVLCPRRGFETNDLFDAKMGGLKWQQNIFPHLLKFNRFSRSPNSEENILAKTSTNCQKLSRWRHLVWFWDLGKI